MEHQVLELFLHQLRRMNYLLMARAGRKMVVESMGVGNGVGQTAPIRHHQHRRRFDFASQPRRILGPSSWLREPRQRYCTAYSMFRLAGPSVRQTNHEAIVSRIGLFQNHHLQ
jgi:hypothetical protein